MRRYETIFISYPELSDDEITALIDRYSAVIRNGKGTIIKVEKWGKRKLAYDVKKLSRGFYVLVDFAGTSAVVTELERNLKIGDKILKYMTVKTNENLSQEELEKAIAPPVVETKTEVPASGDQEKPVAEEKIEPPPEEQRREQQDDAVASPGVIAKEEK